MREKCMKTVGDGSYKIVQGCSLECDKVQHKALDKADHFVGGQWAHEPIRLRHDVMPFYEIYEHYGNGVEKQFRPHGVAFLLLHLFSIHRAKYTIEITGGYWGTLSRDSSHVIRTSHTWDAIFRTFSKFQPSINKHVGGIFGWSAWITDD